MGAKQNYYASVPKHLQSPFSHLEAYPSLSLPAWDFCLCPVGLSALPSVCQQAELELHRWHHLTQPQRMPASECKAALANDFTTCNAHERKVCHLQQALACWQAECNTASRSSSSDPTSPGGRSSTALRHTGVLNRTKIWSSASSATLLQTIKATKHNYRQLKARTT